MKNKKICVYTCITGNYDDLKEINKSVYEENIDYYCFTNNKNFKSDTWKIIYISDDDLDNHLLSRKIKILGHEIINNNYDISVWIDGAASLNLKITDFLNNECDFKNYELFCFRHSVRDCIYQEAKACIQLMKDNPEIIRRQVNFLKSENYPENYGLCEMGLFARDLHSEKVTKTMEIWFDMLLKYSKRDQLSFMYSVYKTDVKLQQLDLNVFDNKYFDWIPHCNFDNLNQYNVFFDNIDNFSIEDVKTYNYKLDGITYIINFDVIKDCEEIDICLTYNTGLFITNINTSFNYIMLDAKFINSNYYFSNKNPIMRIKGKFKENQKVEIKLNMSIIDVSEMINHLEFINNKLEKEISTNENNILKYQKLADTYNNLQESNNLIKNELEMSKKDYFILSDNYNDLNIKYKSLQEEYNIILNSYYAIINSRSWKLITKTKKIFKK